MLIHKAYKYRIYPNKEQRDFLEKTFGCCRFIYNHFLQYKTTVYKETGKSVSYVECSRSFTELRKSSEYLWLNEAAYQPLQQSLRSLDKAYTSFFNKKSKFPRFKRKRGKQSFTQSKNFAIKNGKLNILKCKNIFIVLHRSFT